MEILHYREYPDADESWLDEFENPRKLFVSKVQLDAMKTCGLSNSVLAKIMDVSETTIDTTLTETKESDFIIRRSTRRKYTPEIDDKILKAQSNEDLKEISKEHGISFNKIKQRSYWFKRKGITKI
jgi:transposase